MTAFISEKRRDKKVLYARRNIVSHISAPEIGSSEYLDEPEGGSNERLSHNSTDW